MNTELLHENFLAAIRQKISNRPRLTNELVNILSIEKEAVYRRLRGEVPFTFSEVFLISRNLGISLDNIMGRSTPNTAFFQLNQFNHIEPGESEYYLLDRFLDAIRDFRDDAESELGASSNVIPQPLYYQHTNLVRFSLLKWMHQYMADFQKPFSEITIPEKLTQMRKIYVEELQNIKTTFYVFDSMMFQYFVNDVSYFLGNQMLTREEGENIREELLLLLYEMEEVTTKGHYSNGNSVQVYISDINFDASYSYLEAGGRCYSMIKAFALNSIFTQDQEIFHSLKRCVQALKRYSVLISESGGMQRAEFFRKQRELVKKLGR